MDYLWKEMLMESSLVSNMKKTLFNKFADLLKKHKTKNKNLLLLDTV